MKNHKFKAIFSTVLVLMLTISLSFAPENVAASNDGASSVETVTAPRPFGKWVPVYVGNVHVGDVCVIFGRECRVIKIPISI